mgnify:FL=1
MKNIVRQALTMLVGHDDPSSFLKMPRISPLKVLTERQLIQMESEIGQTLFGDIPEGHRREFFNLDAHTWIWHEEYMENSQQKIITTRYEVQQKGVLKVQDGARYSYLEGEELDNFVLAVQMYYERVSRQIYRRDPQTGYKLS